MLLYKTRDYTSDIDYACAADTPASEKAKLQSAIKKVADKYKDEGLTEGWMNDHMSALPTIPAKQAEIFSEALKNKRLELFSYLKSFIDPSLFLIKVFCFAEKIKILKL